MRWPSFQSVEEGVELTWIHEYCHSLGLLKASANITISKATAWLNIKNPMKGLLILWSNFVFFLFSNTIIYFMLVRTLFPWRHFTFNCSDTRSYFLSVGCSCCAKLSIQLTIAIIFSMIAVLVYVCQMTSSYVPVDVAVSQPVTWSILYQKYTG